MIPKTEHPYAHFVHRVEKPARYVGGEYNAIVKDWDTVACRAALCFPDLYDIGMSHMGTKILYSVVNKAPDLLGERCFAPWVDMRAELEARGLPLLSLETHRPLSDFDIVGFSLQYEMTFTNVLTMLKLGGIPIDRRERSLEDPLVIAGGPNTVNPEPMSDFIDVFVVGDAEERLPRLMRHYAELRDQGATRHEILVALAAEGGVYCPALYTRATCERSELRYVEAPTEPSVPARVERAFLDDISRYRYPDDSPVAVAEAIFDRMSVEIARGCTEGCRFCQAGMIYRPVRERDPDEIVDTLISAIEKGGYDEASVTSLSTADYSCISPLIKKLMDKLRDRRVSLGISSLRAYGLSDELLDEIASVKATGLTFAPEAGTQRMRDVINKNISEDDILTTCHRVFSKGWSRMKLYFMIGLPGEEDEDVAGIAELGREARRIGRSYTNRASVTVSVSSHVPKPHTPFQWVAMDRPEEIRRKQEILFHKTRDYRLTFRRHDMRISHLEGIVSRGDQRVGALIRRAWEAGAHFDGWDDQLRFDVWQEALKTWEAEEGISRDLFLGTIPVDAQLPWDHIDVGLEEGFLKREYKKSMKGRLSPPCGKPAGAKVHHTNLQDAHADERRLVCYHCGIACDLAGMKDARVRRLEQLGAEAPLQPSEKNARENALDRVKQGLTPHSFNQAHKVKFRLRYTKLGAVHLQGHLDMVRIIPRVFRRAGIDVFYSEGFSPKPVMSFGPALGLGAHSVAEYVDIALAADLTAAEVLDRIRAVAPEGMAFTGVRRLKQGDRKLSKVIQAIEYVMAAPPALQADDGLATLQERLNARWQSSDPIVLDVIRKKKPRQVDLRDVVISADAEIEPRYARLTGLPETQLALRIRQRFGGLSLKPVEVSAALTGEGDEPAAILRTGCWHVDGEQWIDPLVADDPDADRVAVAPLD